MSTPRFAKPISAQYSDLFIRRSDSPKECDSPADVAVHTIYALTVFRGLLKRLASACQWIEYKRTQQGALRHLRVSETVSMGEKRFVSIIEVNGAQYLIGGAANQISLLAVLDGHVATEKSSERSQTKGGQA